MKTEERDLAAEDLFECSRCHAILDIDNSVQCSECKELFCELCLGLDLEDPKSNVPENPVCRDHVGKSEDKVRCSGCGVSITMPTIPQDMAPEEELCNACYEKSESTTTIDGGQPAAVEVAS